MMTNQAIEEISTYAFAHVRTLLRGIVQKEELTHEANDLVQNSWEKFLKSYPAFFNDAQVAKLIIYRIAKNEALYYINKLNQRRKGTMKLPASSQNGYYDYLLKDDLAQFMKVLNERQLFIFKALNQYEGSFMQEEIIPKIRDEYEKKFDVVLTIDNYRQAKKRIKLFLLKFWKNDKF